MQLVTFRRQWLQRKLLEKQWRTEEKAIEAWLHPLGLSLHNTTIEDVIKAVEEMEDEEDRDEWE